MFFERFDRIHDALFCSSWSTFGFQHLFQVGSRILSTDPWGGADRGGYCVSPQDNTTHNISIPAGIGGSVISARHDTSHISFDAGIVMVMI
jgi:hypothetical protein